MWQHVLENSNDLSFANDVLQQQQVAVVAVDQRVLINVGDGVNDRSEDEVANGGYRREAK